MPTASHFHFHFPTLTGSRSQAVRLQLPLPPLQLLGFLLELLLFLQELRRGRVYRSLTKKDTVNNASEDRWRFIHVLRSET